MRHSTAKIILMQPMVVFVFLMATVTAESASTTLESRPEAQMTSQEMEKFLEGLSRYLYRLRMEQQVNHQMMSPSQENDDPDDVAAMPATRNHIGSSLMAEEKSASEPASNSVMYPRPSSAKWPWPMENTERDGSYLKQQRPTYGKRNSELINSLLGLPRFMKVVG